MILSDRSHDYYRTKTQQFNFINQLIIIITKIRSREITSQKTNRPLQMMYRPHDLSYTAKQIICRIFSQKNLVIFQEIVFRNYF